ncbi:hypothetical protein ABIB40_002597 [Pedobacter sp. UYP30]|uniref:hypothetical protein n=1 Tax=Pedobacter sp. UYP30 TaxID=1756400 RepID=UPI003399A1A7
MGDLKENILNCLKDLKGSGRFISVHTAEFQFPGLEVDGVGEISYPINETQARALIKVAEKAPFGKGSETIVDTTVRSACEIDANKLTFNGDSWANFLEKILTKIKPDLGLEDYAISAHLYKMLIYEKGDFFLQHKDSEKEKGMFGSLVISLPSKHTGGELVISFEGATEVAAFAKDSGDYKINYAAFYADCDHEIKPLTSGYRVCLIYNLVQQKATENIQLTSVETYAQHLAEIFKKEQNRGHTEPHIVLLGHQYTPENFSIDQLKLNDRPKAEALLQAAQKAGCYAKMCLVTSYLSGVPEDDGRYYDYNEDSDPEAEMGEVYDKSLYIEHWLDNGIPPLDRVGFEETDLIAAFVLDDDEPILKESTGYMGNYGPDLMHWYHYGAVMIWTPRTNAQLLLQQNALCQLEWIGYFSKNLQSICNSEIAAAKFILSTGLTKADRDRNANFNVIADWIISKGEQDFFLELSHELCQFYFTKIDVSHWLKLAHFFSIETIEKIFLLVTQDITMQVLHQLLGILSAFATVRRLNKIEIAQVKKLPHYFSQLPLRPTKEDLPGMRLALDNLFFVEKTSPQDEAWINQMARILTVSPQRGYMNHILVPQLQALKEKTKLTRTLMVKCREYLQNQVDNKPQPPENWYREVPSTSNYRMQWQFLKSFLESPDQRVFDFRKNQNERTALENAITNVVIDLETETIRKGSPHTLRITKTQAAYDREMNKWKEDLVLLNNMVEKIGG